MENALMQQPSHIYSLDIYTLIDISGLHTAISSLDIYSQMVSLDILSAALRV